MISKANTPSAVEVASGLVHETVYMYGTCLLFKNGNLIFRRIIMVIRYHNDYINSSIQYYQTTCGTQSNNNYTHQRI